MLGGGGFDGGFDKGHAFHAVIDGGEIVGSAWFAIEAITNGGGDFGVDIREGLNEGLGVAEGEAGEFLGDVGDVPVATAQDAGGLVLGMEEKLVGVSKAEHCEGGGGPWKVRESGKSTLT